MFGHLSGLWLACRIAAGAWATCVAWGQLRVAEWNVTNYSSGRVAAFQTAIYGQFQGRSMAPDVIVGQEFESAAGVMNFLGLLNSAPGSPGDWAAAPYVNGPDTNNAFFYRTTRVRFLGVTTVSWGGPPPQHPRNVERYDIRPAGYASDGAVLACYSSHMKSGSTDEDRARRLAEARVIRDDAEALPAAWHFLLAADLNIPASSEAAYIELVGAQSNNAGRLYDPIRTPGTWNNNATYRFVHTQDPIGPGGMDDRFDQLLLSADLIDADAFDYLGDAGASYSTTDWNDPNHSYRAWGNDGGSFNQSLRVNGNTMVGPVIAQALRDAAANGGHLPVFLDLRVPPHADSDDQVDFGTVRRGSRAEAQVRVWNAGDVGLWTERGIGELRYTLAASQRFSVPPGPFSDPADGAANVHVVEMDTSQTGRIDGELTIASNAPDEPRRVVPLTGLVVEACDPCDMDCDGAVNAGDIPGFIDRLFEDADPCCGRRGEPNHSGDVNGDGVANASDIAGFIDRLFE